MCTNGSGECKRLLTQTQVAAYLGVGRSTVRRMRKRGVFAPPTALPGNRPILRWCGDDIDNWLKALRKGHK